jgi:hypothetical protein
MSGKCPEFGFDCSEGRLRQLDGYWLPPSTVVLADGSVSAYRCRHDPACLGMDMTAINATRNDSGCAAGYVGEYCKDCADGWAGLSGFCTQCYSPALASLGLFALPLVTASVVSFVTALALEETSGVHQVSV